MALWSTKRRFVYGGSVIFVIAVIIIGIFWSLIYRAPTCSDGVKDGDEFGVDCGGSCKNLCSSDALSPVVLWAKVFNISGDVYSAVAYVENPNINSKNQKASYQFRIYNDKGKLVTIREGETSIPKGKKFVVFETGIILKNEKPKSADFQFLSFSSWEKDKTIEPAVSISHSTLLSTTTTPTITGSVSNNSLKGIPSLELVILLLDNSENVIGASQTFIDDLKKNSSQDFVFTWQKPFTVEPSVINVIYRSI